MRIRRKLEERMRMKIEIRIETKLEKRIIKRIRINDDKQQNITLTNTKYE